MNSYWFFPYGPIRIKYVCWKRDTYLHYDIIVSENFILYTRYTGVSSVILFLKKTLFLKSLMWCDIQLNGIQFFAGIISCRPTIEWKTSSVGSKNTRPFVTRRWVKKLISFSADGRNAGRDVASTRTDLPTRLSDASVPILNNTACL